MTRAPCMAFVALVAWAPPAVAQFAIQAAPAKTPPVIDGAIADGEWAGAAVAAGFVQYEPQRGEPSPFRTEALLLYDAERLYVAFRAWDPEPLTAQLTQRDAQLDRDDSVAVMIDTFADRQTAYLFAVNVLGTQADARVADDGRTTDFNWDAPWRAAANRTTWGWTAELSIPFSAIKFVAGTDRTWGVNFARSRRRSLELSHWAGPLEQPYRVSQFGQLTGLTLAAPERRQQIIPYALTRAQEHRTPDWDAGVDARYALTPQLAAYGTLYPDFATVEADQETVNLTRFEVQLREKRQFFLEGNELFGQRIRTFYSRRIADITGGAKLLGKQGPWTVAALSVVSEPLDTGSRANYTVGRLQRDVLGRSNVAVMVANRRLDGIDSGSIGLDTTLFWHRCAVCRPRGQSVTRGARWTFSVSTPSSAPSRCCSSCSLGATRRARAGACRRGSSWRWWHWRCCSSSARGPGARLRRWSGGRRKTRRRQGLPPSRTGGSSTRCDVR